MPARFIWMEKNCTNMPLIQRACRMAPGQAGLEYKKIRKRGAKIAVFRCLKQYFEQEKPWGSLTGVRPTKFLRDSRQQLGIREAERLFLEDFDISRQNMT